MNRNGITLVVCQNNSEDETDKNEDSLVHVVLLCPNETILPSRKWHASSSDSSTDQRNVLSPYEDQLHTAVIEFLWSSVQIRVEKKNERVGDLVNEFM